MSRPSSRLALGAILATGASQAAPAKVVVAYQTGPDPIEVAFVGGEIAGAFAWDPAFLKAFAGEVAKENASSLDDEAARTAESDDVRAVAGLLGGTPQDQAVVLKDPTLLPASVPSSDAWLGGGDKSGVARIFKDTAAFLKEQRKITAMRDGYGGFVTAAFVAPLSD